MSRSSGSFLWPRFCSHQMIFSADAVAANPIPQQLPLIVSRQLEYPHPRYPPLQAWLETLGQRRDEKLGIVDLHPSIWQTSPRYSSLMNVLSLLIL